VVPLFEKTPLQDAPQGSVPFDRRERHRWGDQS
jgi:hypothetical protein